MGVSLLSSAADVFRLNRVSYSDKGLVVSASYFEIYCSKVFDLLNGKARLRILEDARSRVQVSGRGTGGRGHIGWWMWNMTY